MKNVDAKKIIILMFGITICTIMMTIIFSFVYYGPGRVRAETVDIVGNLVFTMMGAVITYLTLKDDNRTGV